MVDVPAGLAQNSGSIPLNWSMLQILSILLKVIDQRHGMLGIPHEDGLVTAPCPACSGLGHTLVVNPSTYKASDSASSVADDDTAMATPSAPSTTSNTPPVPVVNTGPTQAAASVLTPAPAAVMINTGAAQVANASPAVNTGATQAAAPVLNPAPAAVMVNAGATLAPAPVVTLAPPVVAPAPPVVALAPPVVAPAPPVVTPAPPAVAPTPPAVALGQAGVVNAGGTPTGPPALNPVATPTLVGVINAGGTQPAAPAPIQTGTATVGAAGPQPVPMPLPGIHSIAGTSALAPDQAVFTNANADRFYVVTKGRRVGIFGGWVSTSPYVTEVGGAVYIRFATLDAAIESYTRAYNSGLIAYL